MFDVTFPHLAGGGGGGGALTCKQLVKMNFMGYISGPRWVKFLRKKNIINVI